MVPRVKEIYFKKVLPELMKKHNLKNKNQVPVLDKIVVNVGVGEAKDNPKVLTAAAEELSVITGQKALITKAKKSISNFKLRQGVAIGAKVTLRGNMMWEFFDRLINVALPRVRDFRGLSQSSFDKFNNFSIGVKEQIIFPEINYDDVEKVHGLDITLVIKNGKKRDLVIAFFTAIGFPIKIKEEDPAKIEAEKREEALKKAEALEKAKEEQEGERQEKVDKAKEEAGDETPKGDKADKGDKDKDKHGGDKKDHGHGEKGKHGEDKKDHGHSDKAHGDKNEGKKKAEVKK
ncbi:MAG: 50S ribosomal protein L5 [Spirochaetes bacterium]|nr:50S ribosomal protein L5 [Spirochaetota bacterium]